MPFLVIVNVIDILNGQKFSFPMNSDSNYRMKHLKLEMNSLVHRYGDHRLLFIRNGRIVDDDEYIMSPRSQTVDPDSNTSVDFFFMAQPKAKVVSSAETVCVLDHINLTAAKEWMASHASYSNPEEVRRRRHISRSIEQLSPVLEEQKDGADAEGAAVPPQTVPDPNLNPVPEARMLLIRWIDMNILCRLVVGYFFFIHGSSIMRQFFFFNFAVFYYLYSTGIGEFLCSFLAHRLFTRPAVEAPAGPDSGENPDGTVDPSSGPTLDANGVEIPGTGPHPDPAPEKSWVERLIWEDIRTYYTTGAPIPAGRTGGALLDFVSLVVSVTLSLIPEWSPYGRV